MACTLKGPGARWPRRSSCDSLARRPRSAAGSRLANMAMTSGAVHGGMGEKGTEGGARARAHKSSRGRKISAPSAARTLEGVLDCRLGRQLDLAERRDERHVAVQHALQALVKLGNLLHRVAPRLGVLGVVQFGAQLVQVGELREQSAKLRLDVGAQSRCLLGTVRHAREVQGLGAARGSVLSETGDGGGEMGADKCHSADFRVPTSAYGTKA